MDFGIYKAFLNRDTYELRNKKFLEDTKGIVEDYKAE